MQCLFVGEDWRGGVREAHSRGAGFERVRARQDRLICSISHISSLARIPVSLVAMPPYQRELEYLHACSQQSVMRNDCLDEEIRGRSWGS